MPVSGTDLCQFHCVIVRLQGLDPGLLFKSERLVLGTLRNETIKDSVCIISQIVWVRPLNEYFERSKPGNRINPFESFARRDRRDGDINNLVVDCLAIE